MPQDELRGATECPNTVSWSCDRHSGDAKPSDLVCPSAAKRATQQPSVRAVAEASSHVPHAPCSPVVPHNPYEPPRELPSWNGEQDSGTLAAQYYVGSDLAYRCLRFEVERRTWLRQAIFLLSTCSLMAVLVAIIIDWPFWTALMLLVVFLALNVANLFLPDMTTRYWLRRGLPATLPTVETGDYCVELSADTISWTVDGTAHSQLLAHIKDAFYLGDVLLVFPVADRILPVPRTAQFTRSSFMHFCRTFALRLRHHWQEQPGSYGTS